MTNEKHEKIIDRVRKLLALSKSPNEHEAALAAERAQAILAEHNLSLAEIADEDADEFETIELMKTDCGSWRLVIGEAICRLYFCQYTYTTQFRINGKKSGYVHRITGKAHNVAVAEMMFKYLLKTVQRLSLEGAKNQPREDHLRYRASFRVSCSYRLRQRIYGMIHQAKTVGMESDCPQRPGKSMLPALLSLYEDTQTKLAAYFEKQGGIKITQLRHKTANEDGINDGRRAGDNINLDRQITDDNVNRHLIR